MPLSLISLTEGGGGKKLATWQRTKNAQTVEEQEAIIGEPFAASYIAMCTSTSIATAADHVLQLMGAASTYVRVARITIRQAGNATTAAVGIFTVLRLTSAGTGGTAVTPRPMDTGDSAAASTAMTLPTAKGTEGVSLLPVRLVLRQAILGTATQVDGVWEWSAHPRTKGIIIPPGTANGIAIKTNGFAGASVDIVIEFTETAWL